MSVKHRSHCPRCGICQEEATVASEAQVRVCENCGAVIPWRQQGSGDLGTELLSLVALLLAFAGAFACCFAALRFAVFVVLAMGSLFCLLATIFLEHRKSRSSRRKLWNRLIKSYAGLTEGKKRPAADPCPARPSPDCRSGGSGAE